MNGRIVRNRVLLPLIGVLIVLGIWQGTLIAYRLPVIVLPSPLAVATTNSRPATRSASCWALQWEH